MTDISCYGGVILESYPQDFIAGVNSPIVLEHRNTTYNWLPFFGTAERQSFAWGETFGCVSFSVVHHSIAPALNWMLANNLLPAPALKFFTDNGYVVNGKFDLSERYIVALSGTTAQGNSWQNVAQAVRKFGIVPEWACPNAVASREEYFTVSSSAKALGEMSKMYLNFAWQGIPKENIRAYLVQAPVVLFTPVCPGWDTENPVNACVQPVIHATGNYAVNHDKSYAVFDQYQPFQKNLSAGYPIGAAFQMVVTPIPQALEDVQHYLFARDMEYGERSRDVLYLQARLGVSKTGIYDEETRQAVYSYQLKESVASLWDILWLKGKRVGPKTRNKLNNQLL